MRFFVFVNSGGNPHIKIHPETSHPCGEIMKNIQQGGVYFNTFSIVKSNDSTIIKTGETKNSYWLIVWGSSLSAVMNHPYLQDIAKKLEVKIDVCQNCS